jgi:hypothetical protein
VTATPAADCRSCSVVDTMIIDVPIMHCYRITGKNRKIFR